MVSLLFSSLDISHVTLELSLVDNFSASDSVSFTSSSQIQVLYMIIEYLVELSCNYTVGALCFGGFITPADTLSSALGIGLSIALKC